jgi:uncharacterized protein
MTNPAPEASKPIPEPDEASAPFWEGSLKGKLMLMKCSTCGTQRLPARTHCDECLSSDFAWVEASGRGKVHTFGVMHQKYHPGWNPEIPYNVTIVELDEGPRFPTNLVGIANDQIKVGMPVVVDWERHEDVALPKFRPA